MCLVKDERHFDRFDRVFAAHSRARRSCSRSCRASCRRSGCRNVGERTLQRGGEGADRGARRLGQADGDAAQAARGAEGAAPGRQQMDRHRAAPRRSAPTATIPRACASARTAPQQQRGQGLGPARVRESRRQRRARHAQHQAGAAPAAAIRARGRARRARLSTTRSTPPPRLPAVARYQAGARAAQRREGAAVPRRRRLDGRARPDLRGAVLGGAQRVQAPRALLLPQLPLRGVCGGTTGAASREQIGTVRGDAHLRRRTTR